MECWIVSLNERFIAVAGEVPPLPPVVVCWVFVPVVVSEVVVGFAVTGGEVSVTPPPVIGSVLEPPNPSKLEIPAAEAP